MADFPGEARLSVVQLPSEYHSHAQSPAQVDENHILVRGLAHMHIFPIGHGPGVVLYIDRHFELLFEELAHRDVVADEIGQRIALFRVHASGKAHAHSQHFLPAHSELVHLILDALADLLEGIRIGFKHERNLGNEGNQLPLEIAQCEVKVLPGDIHAYKISGLRIEAVYIGTPSALGAVHLALIFDKAAVHHVHYRLGNGRDADVEALAEICDAVGIVFYAKPEDVFFYGLQLSHIHSIIVILTNLLKTFRIFEGIL